MSETEFASTMSTTVVFAMRNTQKVRTSVLIPAILISISVLVPLLCAIWRWSRSGRVTPAYVQEQPVEKPKLCEVALVDTGHGGYWSFKAPLPHPWCRLRPLSIHQHPYDFVRASCCDASRPSSAHCGRPKPQESRASSGTLSRDRRLSQLRVGVLVSMPSPKAGSGRTSPGEPSPIPPLYLGVTDVLHLDERL